MKHVSGLLKKYCPMMILILILALILGTALVFPKQLMLAEIQNVSLTVWTIYGGDSTPPPDKWDIKLSLEEGLALTKIISSSILIRDPFLAQVRAVDPHSKYFMVWVNEWGDGRVVFNIYADGTVGIWLDDETIMCRPIFPMGKKLHQLVLEEVEAY